MVYHFYLVFNCPHLKAYSKLVSTTHLVGFPKSLTSDVVRKYYPHHNKLNYVLSYRKKTIPNNPKKIYDLTFCSEQVEIDILMMSTPTFSIPSSAGGYRHVVMVVDDFSPFLS